MPINTYRSGIKVETNIQGQMVDNDEFVTQRAAYEHHHHPTEPWMQGYEPQREIFFEDTVPVEPDPKLEAANRRDLKIRNFY